jgi:hypothetical protein
MIRLLYIFHDSNLIMTGAVHCNRGCTRTWQLHSPCVLVCRTIVVVATLLGIGVSCIQWMSNGVRTVWCYAVAFILSCSVCGLPAWQC